MDSWEIIILGIVSIAALVLMLFVGYDSITGAATGTYEPFNIGLTFESAAIENYPALESIRINQMDYDPSELPTRELLAPQILGFAVDRISVPEINFYNSISLKKDKIHVFSGIAGYYQQDPTKYIGAYLCTYAYKIAAAPLSCEQVPLSYKNNKISFARGYAPDYYIADQAAGTDFGALFVLANPDYGILAASPVAYLRWVSN
jgi:hypothetical protein